MATPQVNRAEYLTDVTLLCTACRGEIKARINTKEWIRCEFIGPNGECLKCYQEKRNAQQFKEQL